jgi:hypothetical protein
MLTISSFIEPKKKGFCFGLLLEKKKRKKRDPTPSLEEVERGGI